MSRFFQKKLLKSANWQTAEVNAISLGIDCIVSLTNFPILPIETNFWPIFQNPSLRLWNTREKFV